MPAYELHAHNIASIPYRAIRRAVFLRRRVVDGLTGLQARKNRRNPSFFRREREVSVPGLGSLRNEKEELHTFF